MEMIRKENICMVESIKDKKELFHFLAEFMAKQGQIENDEIEKIENGLWKREELSLTGVGNGVAIPHVQNEAVSASGIYDRSAAKCGGSAFEISCGIIKKINR